MEGLCVMMDHSTSILLTLLILALPSAHGGNVLVFPLDGSHWVNMKILTDELHSRGHNVTVVRASNSWYIKETSPHYTSITIPNTGGFEEQDFGSFVSKLIQIRREGNSAWARLSMEMEILKQFSDLHRNLGEMIIQMFEDEKLMQSLRNAHYDVVLTDPALGGGVLLAHYLSLPLVFNVRWTVEGEAHFAIAPSPLSYVPFPGAELTDSMSFSQRVKNMLCYAFGCMQISYITKPVYTALTHRYFGPGVDYLSLFQAADIWLMRNDFVFEFPRPTMPNVVYMGGFQCKPSKPLPQDLEDFVQSSGEHGVIIMSLGTLISQLPHDLTAEIAAAFAQLPQKIIWRYTGERPTTLGNNTLLVDWMPQNDLLGHPKTRAFVAHGGTNGVQEAIYHGVPIVGLPLIFDQPDNLFRMGARGAAKIVDIANLDRSVFLQAIQEVLHDPSYRMNMQMLSRLHQDQPMKPLDRAIFWVEYVMRHKGAAHLRTESYKMPWYSYHSVDVIAVLLAAILLIIVTTIAVIKFLCCWAYYKRKIKCE
ncbi:UDP-glucuronosyltransferase 2C1-like [Megalops cyprinoides]|uniref:UDP-glucuronosyltransferase 2C1-like n=1 Tax=Megalops cyprinoides TaxID=118141 RepID=UPI0018644D5D|nr:UDP-glucuronosyltransferase 2C1-like [Megalops cyprinoides]